MFSLGKRQLICYAFKAVGDQKLFLLQLAYVARKSMLTFLRSCSGRPVFTSPLPQFQIGQIDVSLFANVFPSLNISNLSKTRFVIRQCRRKSHQLFLTSPHFFAGTLPSPGMEMLQRQLLLEREQSIRAAVHGAAAQVFMSCDLRICLANSIEFFWEN